MTDKLKKNDFVELEFTGKSNNEIFDTTDPKEAEKLGSSGKVKPIIISIGHEMVLKCFDDDLEGKELNKKYTLHLQPEQGFGKRDPKMIRIIPMRFFIEQKIQPQRGMSFNIDNHIVKILSVSGGRVTADFNNPLAGKEIDYEFTIKKKVTDDAEKVNALQDYFFKQRFEFELKDKKVIFKDEKIKPVIEMFNQKFKDMTGLDFEAEVKKEETKKTEEKKLDSKEKPKVGSKSSNPITSKQS